jgi:hypothetical protein
LLHEVSMIYRSRAGRSAESISGGGEVVLAFWRLEEITDVADLRPEGVDGPDGFCAKMSFKLREGHFDRIEVRAIGWQDRIHAPLASMAFAAAGLLWAAKLSITLSMMTTSPLARAGARWVSPGLADAPVHRGIDDEGGGAPVAAQAGDEGRGHPMPERRLAAEPLALRAVAAQTGHLGCRSGRVEKDQRFKPPSRRACGGPFRARRFDVGAILLARPQGFF